MKSESLNKPNPLEIVDKGEYSEVVLTENAEQIPAADELPACWQYDEYRLSVRSREGLFDAVNTAREVWLQQAREAENTPPEPTIQERIKDLEQENAALRAENQFTGAAVEELIQFVLEGGV